MLFLPSNNCKKNFEFTALKKDKIGYMYLELIKDFLCYFPRPQRVICILLKNEKNNVLTTSEFGHIDQTLKNKTTLISSNFIKRNLN